MEKIQESTEHEAIPSRNAVFMRLGVSLLFLATLLSFAVLCASGNPFLSVWLILLLLAAGLVIFVILLLSASSSRYTIRVCIWFTVWLIICNLTIITKVPKLQERLSIEKDHQEVLLAALKVEDFRKNTGQYPKSKEDFENLFQNDNSARNDTTPLSYHYDDSKNAYTIIIFHGFGPHILYDSSQMKTFEDYW
ncbi:MAG: hypothetical protein ABFD91_12750 [Anaerohalosphaeraceae bacterium]